MNEKELSLKYKSIIKMGWFQLCCVEGEREGEGERGQELEQYR